MKLALAAAAFIAAVSFAQAAHADGDVEAGKVVFRKCAVCHSIDPAKKGIGPLMLGIVGRPSASVAGYSYSEGMKAANKTWDAATLGTYLANPKALVPGTKMVFPGLPKQEDRDNVIAYLSTLK